MHIKINKIKSKHSDWEIDEANIEAIPKGFINI